MTRHARTIIALAFLVTLVLSAPAQDDNGVAVLVKQLKDKDDAVRLMAAKSLGKMGGKAKAAIPALIELLKDPDADVRAVVQNALKSIAAGAGTSFKFRIGRGDSGLPGAPPVISPRNVPRPEKRFNNQIQQDKQVKAALSWLAKNQRPDGSWATGMGMNVPATVVTTSFSGLALMASGKKQYATNVNRAVAYVSANVLQNRGLRVPEQLDQSNWKVAIGGYFLCEYYGTQKKLNPRFKSAPLQRLIEMIVADGVKRMETSGGWGHTPRVKNPLGYVEMEIMSNWMLAMFGAAKELGIKLPEQKVDKAVAYIDECCNEGRGDVGYSERPGQKGFGCPCRTGGAIFGFRLLGKQDQPIYPLMVDSFKVYIADSNEGHGSLAIGLLSSALGARQLGDDVWQEFKDRFFQQILDHAEKNGTFGVIKGESPKAQANADGMVGSAYTTSIYALMLQLEAGNLRFMGAKRREDTK